MSIKSSKLSYAKKRKKTRLTLSSLAGERVVPGARARAREETEWKSSPRVRDEEVPSWREPQGSASWMRRNLAGRLTGCCRSRIGEAHLQLAVTPRSEWLGAPAQGRSGRALPQCGPSRLPQGHSNPQHWWLIKGVATSPCAGRDVSQLFHPHSASNSKARATLTAWEEEGS